MAATKLLNAAFLRHINVDCLRPCQSLCGPPLVRSPFDNPLRRYAPRQTTAVTTDDHHVEATNFVLSEQRTSAPEGIGLKEFRETTTLQALNAFGRQLVDAMLYVRGAIRNTAFMPITKRQTESGATTQQFAAHIDATPIVRRFTLGSLTSQMQLNFRDSRLLGMSDPQLGQQHVDFAVSANKQATANEPDDGFSAGGSGAGAGSSSAGVDGGGTTGGGEDETHQQRREQHHRTQRRVLTYSVYTMVGMFGLGTLSLVLAYGPEPENGDQYSDSVWALAVFRRVRDALASWRTFMKEPIREKLLPDPVKPPWHQPKYTVVIEMRNVLICPKWEYKKGHYFVKRPAVDYFLDLVGYPNFELVIYTSETMMQAAPVVQQLDPKGGHISHALFRECTKTSFINGVAMKDLSRLNRDLSKVIYIDWDPQAFQLNPENVLRVPKWEGNMEDTSLVDLAELLKTILLTDLDDVRPTLQMYSQFDNPLQEFRRRAQQMAQKKKESGEVRKNRWPTNVFSSWR